MAELTINTGWCSEVSARDARGETAAPTPGGVVFVEIVNTLALDGDALSFGVVVRVEPSLAGPQDASTFACSWLRHALPERFQAGTGVDYFSSTKLTATAMSSANPPGLKSARHVPVVVSLSAAQTTQLQAALSHLARVRGDFRTAKARLGDLADQVSSYQFKQTWGEANLLLSKLSSILECSGEILGSNSRHIHQARQDYANLASRKVEANASYKASLRELRAFAMLLEFPSFWGRRPPTF